MTRGLAALLLVLGAAETAAAQPGPRLITRRDEAEVRALFSPHTLGGEVRPGWRLWSIRLEEREIRVGVRGPDDAGAEMSLLPPDEGPSELRPSRSFAMVVRDAEGDGRAALEHLGAAVRRNDRGEFWTGGTLRDRRVHGWVGDGVVLSLLGALLLLALLWRSVRAEPERRRIAIALGLIFAVGAALRLTLSPPTILEAWSYGRIHPVAESVYGGIALRWVSRALELRIFEEATIRATTLAYAVLTPLAVYLQARQLLRSVPIGLAAAGILAVLPQHLRFSHSDTAFVCSIAMSCLCDVLVHTACTDRSRAWRVVALVALPPLTLAMLHMRPLNVLFLPLLVAHAIWLAQDEGPDAPVRGRAWRWIAVGGVVVPGAIGIATHLLTRYAREVGDGLSPHVLFEGLHALFSFRFNTLIHPWITPPLILLLAIAGGVVLWRTRERGRLAYLLGWLFAFFFAHAYVLPTELAMQARYHLHVILPFAFLAAVAFAALAARTAQLAAVVALLLALSPFFHRSFVGDLGFDDQREHVFLIRLRPRIPEQCVVVEPTGGRWRREDARMPRIGALIDRGRRSHLWRPRPVRDAAGAIRELELGARGGGCAVWYQSLLCYAGKPRTAPIAPECAAVREHFAGRLRLLASRRFPHRLYDDNLAEGLRGSPAPAIALAAWRVRP